MFRVPPFIVKPPSACTPSSALSMFIVPLLTVTVPSETVSSSSGEDLRPSPSDMIFTVPPFTTTLPSLATPLLAAETVSVKLSFSSSPTVSVASEAPFMPFLPSEASAVSSPVPVTVTEAPLLILMTAPSSLVFVSVFSPSITISVSEFFPTVTVPSSAEVSVRFSNISVTPSLFFSTVMLPSSLLPVTTYVPAPAIVMTVPSIE